MIAMKTISRAAVLAVGGLLIGPGLPFGGAAEGTAQTVDAAPAGDRSLDRAIAAQRERVDAQTRPADRASALNDLANLLELRGDVEGAFEHYRAAIAEDGNLAPAHYNLALLAYSTGDSELASGHLETAIGLDPRNAWAHYQLGRIADDAGDSAAAVEHYIHALSLDTRLAFADVNPHFALNRHATEVLLRANRSQIEAVPPRTYSEPGRISGMLLPRTGGDAAAVEAGSAAEATEAPASASAPASDRAPAEESARRASRASGPEGESDDGVRQVIQSRGTLPAGGQAGEETYRRSAPLATRFETADSGTAAAEERAESGAGDASAQERPRVFTREHLRTRTLGGGRMVGGSPGGAAPSRPTPIGGSRGGVQLGTPVGPGGRQAPPPAAGTFRGSGGRFQPSARSSAQLETTIRRNAVPAP